MENTPLDAAQMRNQLNGLNDQFPNKATAVPNVAELNIDISDPPTQSNLQDVVNKVNELINALKA